MEERGGVNKGRHPDSHPVRLARFFTVHPGKKCRRRRFRLRRWWEGSEGCVSAWFSSGQDQICPTIRSRCKSVYPALPFSAATALVVVVDF